MLELAGIREGMRVLDVASGGGEPALRVARRVGAAGHVLAVDLSADDLGSAREHAEREGLHNISFRVADAESLELDPDFDRATARWGLMYMRDPVRALSAMRSALVRDGLLVAALWAEPERVDWWTIPRRVTSRYVSLPATDPEGPGPCRYARLSRIEADFVRAGFGVEHVEEMTAPILEGVSSADIAAWIRTVLPSIVADLSPSDVPRWEADLAAACEPLRMGSRFVLGGVTRLVVARPAGTPRVVRS